MVSGSKEFHHVTACRSRGDSLGEGPVWCERQQCLWWVDIVRGLLQRWRADDSSTNKWKFEGPVAGIGLTQNAELLIALKTKISLFDPESGRLDQIAELETTTEDVRLNDCAMSPEGRFHFGTCVESRQNPDGAIYNLAGGGIPLRVKTGLYTSNGLAFSLDGHTAYVSDSAPDVRKIFAYDYDMNTGVWSNARLFFDTFDLPGRPDGACVDADNYLWYAGIDGAEIVRLTPDGKIDKVVPVPMKKPTKICFGGAYLDRLYVTSLAGFEGSGPMDGSLIEMDVGCCGVAPYRWSNQSG